MSLPTWERSRGPLWHHQGANFPCFPFLRANRKSKERVFLTAGEFSLTWSRPRVMLGEICKSEFSTTWHSVVFGAFCHSSQTELIVTSSPALSARTRRACFTGPSDVCRVPSSASRPLPSAKTCGGATQRWVMATAGGCAAFYVL